MLDTLYVAPLMADQSSKCTTQKFLSRAVCPLVRCGSDGGRKGILHSLPDPFPRRLVHPSPRLAKLCSHAQLQSLPHPHRLPPLTGRKRLLHLRY